MRTMREEGASWVDVASQFGIGVATAREHARRLGLPIADRPDRVKTQTGPVGLAAAVVQRAVDDALSIPHVPGSKTTHNAERPTVEEHDAAIRFCTADRGQWAKEREWWCDAAGILPDAVRYHVLNKIAEARGGA